MWQPKFAGRYEKDLDDVNEIFETDGQMCDLIISQKKNSIPVMLQGNALYLFNKEENKCDSFDDAESHLRNWYNFRGKQTRLLRDWQIMRLTDAMDRETNSSDISVYRTFAAMVTSIQKQLNTSYHGCWYLHGQLLMSIDIPAI